MNILFIGTKTVRLNRADSVIYMQQCAIMTQLGHNVTLITPMTNKDRELCCEPEIWKMYNLENTFRLVELLVIFQNITLTRIQIYFKTIVSFISIYQKQRCNVCFSFSKLSTLALIHLKSLRLLNVKIVFTAASIEEDFLTKYIAKRCDYVTTSSEYNLNILDSFGVDKSKIFFNKFITFPENFNSLVKVNEALFLKNIGVEGLGRIATYAGKIGINSKEINYILQAAQLTPNVHFIIVGARKETGALEYYKKHISSLNISNTTLIEYLPLKEYMQLLIVSDLLLSYYSAHDSLSMYQRKPTKASLYLCAGKPIIFSDMPSLREFLPVDSVYFVEPDNPTKLAKTIDHIFNNQEEASIKAKQCLLLAEKYSAKNMIKRKIEFCS